MIRLIVVVEGQTEEAFIKDVLAPHLAAYSVYVSVTIVGKMTAHRRGHQGRGGGHFKHWRKDIERILGGDSGEDLRVTTLFDLYGLPEDFPGMSEHGLDPDTNRRCDMLQTALADTFSDRRLLPYLQRHEFEALVLASLTSLRLLLDAKDDIAGLDGLETNIAGKCPEDINDGLETSPSKRILTYIPGYNKTLHGPLAATGAGLSELRRLCPRFHAWMSCLESLG